LLIGRCAWHQRYWGYPLLKGIVSWRGWTVRFTDGICEKCLQRFRSEHRSFFERRRSIDLGIPDTTSPASPRSERPADAAAPLHQPAA
jgi:hypothetical protein